MSLQLDLTAMNPVLKELIDNQIVQDATYKNNVLYSMLKKNTNMGGKYTPQPIQIGKGQGRSANYTAATANQTANVFKEFLLTPVKDYSIGTIDRLTMLSANSDKKAFVQALKSARDGALDVLNNSLGQAVYGSGTGTVAAIGSITSGVITLANPQTAVYFELNQTLQQAATDGGTPVSALGYVVDIDRVDGTVTVSASAIGGSAGTPTAWASGGFLLINGDSNAKMSGMQAWLLATAPSGGDNFYGVNRSVDRVRLGGCFWDASQQSLEEGVQDGLNFVDTVGGGKTDIVVMNPYSFTNFRKSLGSKVQYVDMQATPTVGFRGIEIDGPNGTVKVLSDRWCPPKTALALQMDTWQLWSVGEAPALVEDDGLIMRRTPGQDSFFFELAAYIQLGCNAPGKNGLFNLSA
jgi:hypothetical protein